MNEFLFGSLATPSKRADRVREEQHGLKHGNRLEPRAPRSGEKPVLTVTAETNRKIDEILCHISQPEDVVITLRPVRTEWDMLNWAYFQVWQATLPAYSDGTMVRYALEAYATGDDGRRGSDAIPVEGGQAFSYLVGDPAAPAWSREAVIYQVFPDRFHPGDGRTWNSVSKLSDIHGGTVQGIIERLDYVADLGFNCVWLNPFFPDETHHGYHATDYFTVNPRLGTLDDVRQLVERAHDKGIRLLLDFVANHWGSKHQSFQMAQADRNSDYYHWYHWNTWPHEYETYYSVKDLPKVNVDYPAARAYLLNSVRYWLGDIGFDGLRLDHVTGPSHDFWTELRSVVKGVNPQAWLFGEATDSPELQLSYEGRFDGCLDFMLAQALRDTFAFGTMDVVAFDAFLHGHEAYFPAHFSRPSFLDNHDMDRFLWLVGGDKRRLKLAALSQFTLSGPPIVYYGTEVGVSQDKKIGAKDSQGMAECRQPMLWGDSQDVELREYYRWLIRLRHSHPGPLQTPRRTVHVDAQAGTYAYMYADEKELLLVALNASDEARSFDIQLGEFNLSHTFTLKPWSGDVLDQRLKT